MLTEELIQELKLIAYCDMAKPANRVNALASLARNDVEVTRIKETLRNIAVDALTPDSVKVRAIDLLDKLDAHEAPKDLTTIEAEALKQSLLEEYVRTA